MASKKLTEYERKRLENIKRNEQMLASFNIKSTASQLTSISKCKRQQIKSYKLSPEKKQKIEESVVLRSSLRIRGVKPDASTLGGLPDDFHETPHNMRPKRGFEPASKGLCRESEPFSMSDAYRGECSNEVYGEDKDPLQCPLVKDLWISTDAVKDGLSKGRVFGAGETCVASSLLVEDPATVPSAPPPSHVQEEKIRVLSEKLQTMEAKFDHLYACFMNLEATLPCPVSPIPAFTDRRSTNGSSTTTGLLSQMESNSTPAQQTPVLPLPDPVDEPTPDPTDETCSLD